MGDSVLKTLSIFVFLILTFSNNLFSEAWYDDLISPVTTDAKYITFAGSLATAMVYLHKNPQPYRKRESISSAQPFGKYGLIGDALGRGYLNATYSLGALAIGYFGENDKYLKSGEHMAKASLYTTGITFVLKNIIDERRPGYPDDKNSFPSGHSSASFAFASVVTARHGWYWGTGAYLAAAFISISRINDDFHYLHDVLFGITIGTAYGWGTHYNYEKGNGYFLSPIFNDKGSGLALSWNF